MGFIAWGKRKDYRSHSSPHPTRMLDVSLAIRHITNSPHHHLTLSHLYRRRRYGAPRWGAADALNAWLLLAGLDVDIFLDMAGCCVVKITELMLIL